MFSAAERVFKAPVKRVWELAGDFTRWPHPTMPLTIVTKGNMNDCILGANAKSG